MPFNRIETQDLHHLAAVGQGRPPSAEKIRAFIQWVQRTAKPITNVEHRAYIRRMLLVWEIHLHNLTDEPLLDVSPVELIGWERPSRNAQP